MPLSKHCPRCGKRVGVGETCKCSNHIRYKPTTTDKYSTDIKQFYKTAEWLTARDRCIANCYGLDLYSYYELGIIEYGQTVHHITPIIDDYSKRLEQGNLIYLTESNHRLIHKLYETEQKIISDRLRGYVKMFSAFSQDRTPSSVNAKT